MRPGYDPLDYGLGVADSAWAIYALVSDGWHVIPQTVSHTRAQAIAALGAGNIDEDTCYDKERRAGRLKACRCLIRREEAP